MLVDFLITVAGLIILVIGGDLMVRGASSLARRVGVSPLAIGLTVVAFGTSAPELAVNVTAAWRGAGGMSFGNIFGSNMANIGLVVALTALIVIRFRVGHFSAGGGRLLARAALLLTVGESYRKMRENAEARDFIQSVLPDVQASLGENHSTVLRLRHVLAGALTTVGEFDEGANMLREDQPKVEATFGPESLDAAKGIRLLGVNRADVNETEEAEALFDRAISLFRRLGAEGSDDLSLALMEQGALMRAIGLRAKTTCRSR